MQKAALETKLKAFEKTCREKGIRLTQQRIELYREIAMDTSHPSVEEIYRRIRPKMPTISLDTVYRTLSAFQSHGIIGKVEVLDDRARFDSNPKSHCHLVCVECKGIQDVDWPEIEKAKQPAGAAGWGRVESRHVEIRGRCRACLKKGR